MQAGAGLTGHAHLPKEKRPFPLQSVALPHSAVFPLLDGSVGERVHSVGRLKVAKMAKKPRPLKHWCRIAICGAADSCSTWQGVGGDRHSVSWGLTYGIAEDLG